MRGVEGSPTIGRDAWRGDDDNGCGVADDLEGGGFVIDDANIGGGGMVEAVVGDGRGSGGGMVEAVVGGW